MRLISPAVATEIHEHATSAHRCSASLQRQDLVDQITRINATATSDFLSRFGDKALRTYLDHLQATLQPRGRRAVWVRPGDTAAANTAELAF